MILIDRLCYVYNLLLNAIRVRADKRLAISSRSMVSCLFVFNEYKNVEKLKFVWTFPWVKTLKMTRG